MSRTERLERLAAVERLLLAGASPLEVKATLAAEHDVDDRTIAADIRAVEAQWKRAGTTREKQMLLSAYRRALAAHKFSPAIAAAGKLVSTQAGAVVSSIERYRALGAAPAGGMNRAIWSQAVMVAGLEEVIGDEGMPKEKRHALILRYGRAIAALTPYAEIHDAEMRIRAHAADIESDVDPEVTRVPDGTPGPLRAN